MDPDIRLVLSKFLQKDAAKPLLESKRHNILRDNDKYVQSTARTFIESTLNSKMDAEALNLLSDCFKVIYRLNEYNYDSVEDIKRHQVFIIKLLEIKKPKKALEQLSCLHYFIAKTVNCEGSLQLNLTSIEILVLGIPFNEDISHDLPLPLIGSVIAHHFLVLQCLLQVITLDIKSFVSSPNTLIKISSLKLVSDLLLSESSFMRWLNCNQDATTKEKYQNNIIKLVKGYMKVVTILRKRIDSNHLQEFETCLLIKLAQFSNEQSLLSDTHPTKAHLPYIEDIKHLNFTNLDVLFLKINSNKILDSIASLLNLVENPSPEAIFDLKLNLGSSQKEMLINQEFLKLIRSFPLTKNDISQSFVDTILSYLASKVSLLKQLTSSHLLILDAFTVYIKDLINLDCPTDFSSKILAQLFSIYGHFHQFKRIRNISNLFYNLGVKTKNINFLNLCIKYETFIKENDKNEAFDNLQQKVHKVAFFLHEQKLFNKSLQVLCGYLKVFDLGGSSLASFYDNHYQTKDTTSIQLLVKNFISNNSFSINIFRECWISDSFQVHIIIDVLKLLDKMGDTKEKTILANDIVKSLSYSDNNLNLLVYYHYYNLSGIVLMLQLNVENFPSDNLILSGVYLQRSICLMDESDFLLCINYFESYLKGSFNERNMPYEKEIFRALILFLKLNALNGYIIHFIEQYKNRKRKIDDEMQIFCQLELCTAYLKLSASKEASDNLTMLGPMLKEMKEHSLRDVLRFNLLQLEFCLVMKNTTMAKEKFNRVLKFLRSKEEFSISSSSHNFIEKLKNLILIAKFQLLTSTLNFLLGHSFASFINLKIAIKLLYSITRKLSLNIPKATLNEIRWETTGLLFEAFDGIVIILMHLGVSRDLLYFYDEFIKLDKSVFAPVTNCFNNMKFATYNYLLQHDNEIRSCCLKIRDYQRFSLVSSNVSIRHCFTLLMKYFNAQPDNSIILEFIDQGNHIESALKLKSYNYDKLEFDFLYLSSLSARQPLISPTVDLAQDSHRRILQNVIESKRGLFESISNLAKFPSTRNLLLSNFALPCVISEGVLNDNLVPVESLNLLIKSKQLLLDRFKAYDYHELSVHELNDLYKVLNYCLSIISSMSIFRASTSLLVDLFYLLDISRFLPFKNDKFLNHSSITEVLPNDIESGRKLVAFDCLSREFHHELNCVLPQSWTAITIDVCSYSGDLIISKVRRGSDPFFVRLSLDRFHKRDSNIPDVSFNDALSEFKDIIRQSDLSTKSSTTSRINSKEDRKAWWKLRFGLDSKLKDLIDHVESFWLGGFRSIFATNDDSEEFKKFKIEFLEILRQLLPSRSVPSRFMEFEDNLILAFYNLRECESMEIDDLFYFLIDSLNTHGEKNKYGNVNFEKVRQFVKRLLEKYRKSQSSSTEEHIVLVVSSYCTFFPWESMRCLRQKSVSRIPSLHLMLNMLKNRNSDLTIRDKSNVYYVLNPGGDLRRTEENFKPLFSEMKNWEGISGSGPDEMELMNKLMNKDLFIYLGHGGCEHYLRVSTLYKACLPERRRLPPSLLIGCSSGTVKSNGYLESTGNIYNWLTCGTPMMLVNLWDVTDKDIDMFTLSVFAKWGLLAPLDGPKNICEAVSESRDRCNLTYLNGAAPVVYGLPLRLQ
ncbi:uncharacterized protein PRCAT00004987001 [Priceomyces carsonii]|uniref:uncharacterized protein n=1 Tax=Priceomyces carsonii TaxID=28549 RepID=UPI002ED7A08D|nr:unnamed protein product [Priceomyces carsonii]